MSSVDLLRYVIPAATSWALSLAGGHLPHARPAMPEPPPAWVLAGTAPADYTVGLDRRVAHSGTGSGFIRSRGGKPRGFGTLMQVFDAERFRGKRVRLRAWVRARDVRDWAGAWMRVEGADPDAPLAADFMQTRPIQGSVDWKAYDIVLDVTPAATRIGLGILLAGRGTVWIDDLALEPVDADVPTTAETGWLATGASPWNLNFEH